MFGRRRKDKAVKKQTAAQRKAGSNSPAARRAAAKASTRSRPSASAYASVEKTPTGRPKATASKTSTKTPTKAELRKKAEAKENIAASASKVTGSKKTKGGEYKTFAKGSTAAQSFRSKYASAKKAGQKTFTWNGKKYSTK
jgi:hypothetical protein